MVDDGYITIVVLSFYVLVVIFLIFVYFKEVRKGSRKMTQNKVELETLDKPIRRPIELE